MSESTERKNELVYHLRPLEGSGAKILDYQQSEQGYEGQQLEEASRRSVRESDVVIIINPPEHPREGFRQSNFWTELDEAIKKCKSFPPDANPVLVIGPRSDYTQVLGTPFSPSEPDKILARIRKLRERCENTSATQLHGFLQQAEKRLNEECKSAINEWFRKNRSVTELHVFRLADRQPGKIPWDLAQLQQSSRPEDQISDILTKLMPRTNADKSTSIEYAYSIDSSMNMLPTNSNLLAGAQNWLNTKLHQFWKSLVTGNFSRIHLYSDDKVYCICPLKCVNLVANRDIVGFVVFFDEKNKVKCPDLCEALAPLMRYQTVAKMRYELKTQEALSRQKIQHICLDACLTLTGCDWGCIKTSCITSSHGQNPEEHVAAECVFHCPVFYREGAFPDGDDRISRVLRGKSSQIITFDVSSNTQPHPAKAAYVAIIPSRFESFDGIPSENNPRLRTAAFVMQHTDAAYLVESVNINKEIIEQVTRRYRDAIDLIAYREAYESTQRIRYELAKLGGSESASGIVEKTMTELLDMSIGRCLRGIPCAFSLLWWDAQFSQPPSPLCSTPGTDDFFSKILGISLYGTKQWSQTLLFRACNSRATYVLKVRAGVSTLLTLYRRIEHDFHMQVVLHDAEKQIDAATCVVLQWDPLPRDLVNSNSFDLAVVPLVSSDGRTVGCICICAARAALKDQHLDDLMQDEGVRRLSRILYQLRHKMRF
jgi:hypothetical protein